MTEEGLSFVGKIIQRMKEALDISTDAELAAALGVGSTAVSNWRKRNSIPYDDCMNLAMEHSVSLDWMILGRGVPRPKFSKIDKDIAELAIKATIKSAITAKVELLTSPQWTAPKFLFWYNGFLNTIENNYRVLGHSRDASLAEISDHISRDDFPYKNSGK